MLDLVTSLFAACIISYTIAVLMPGWRSLLGMTITIGILLSSDTSRRWIISCLQSSQRAFCEPCFLGNTLLMLAMAGFTTGAIVRGLAFLLEARGVRPRGTIPMRIAGAAIVPALLLFAPTVLTWPGALLR